MIAVAEPDIKNAFTTSCILHGAFFLALIFGMPHLKPKPIEFNQPIAVDIVDIGPVTTTQVQGTGNIAKKNDLAPSPMPAKPEPAPAKAEAKPTPPAAAPKPDDSAALKNLINGETKAKAAADKTNQQSDQQFGSLLKNLSKQKAAAADDSKSTAASAAPSKAAAGAPGIVSDKLMMSEEDALRHQIEKCWVVPTGARDAQNLIIELHLEVNPDRTVQSVDIVNSDRMSDPFFRAAAESARRAVLNPNCSPLNLPEDKASLWHSINLRFNPQDVL